MHSQFAFTQSPLATTKIPYDVLREIFLHCLPRFPLDAIQPNAKSAPILLCHVCSFWRAVALETPPLWSHLRYRLPIRWKDGQPIAWNARIFRRDMKFLRWWRGNQGSIATYLRFLCYEREVNPHDKKHPLTDEEIRFFVGFLSSARHLDVGQFSVYLFQQIGTISSPAEWPQLYSLVTRYPNNTPDMKKNYWNWKDEQGDEDSGSDDNDDGTHSKSVYEEDDEPNFSDEKYDESSQHSNEEDDRESISVDAENVSILNDREANSNEEEEFLHSDDSHEEDDYAVQVREQKPLFVPFHIPPTLHRLCICYVDFRLPETSLDAFTSWSRLTHLSLHHMFIPSDVWYPLIRGLPNLQCGFFNVFFRLIEGDPEPSTFILPFLSTLSMELTKSNLTAEDDLVGEFLKNLQLPVLHDLSIYGNAGPVSLPYVAIKVNNVLRSAPMITKLTIVLQSLGYSSASFFTHPFFESPGSDIELEWKDVEKISALAPHLTNLRLDMCSFRPDESDISSSTSPSKRPPYWKKFLDPSYWLDLASPANAIQKVTAIVKKLSRDGPLIEPHIRDALNLDEAHRAGDVVFEIVEAEKRALSPNSVGWRPWGPSPL